MSKVLAAVVAYLVIAGLLLYNDIKDFIWTHPWWHSFLVAIPSIIAVVLATAFVPTRYKRNRAKRSLKSLSYRKEMRNLTQELDTERNQHLQQIASNTQQRLTDAEVNARTLRKYLGQRAHVSEAGRHWGVGGAVIAAISENNILTLFNPAGYSSSYAWGQTVKCDKIHIDESTTDTCALQINIVERYGPQAIYGQSPELGRTQS